MRTVGSSCQWPCFGNQSCQRADSTWKQNFWSPPMPKWSVSARAGQRSRYISEGMNDARKIPKNDLPMGIIDNACRLTLLLRLQSHHHTCACKHAWGARLAIITTSAHIPASALPGKVTTSQTCSVQAGVFARQFC